MPSNIINQNNIICIFFARAKRAWRIDPLRMKIRRNTEKNKNIFQSITTTISRCTFLEWLYTGLYIAAVNWSKCIVILPHRWLLYSSSSFLLGVMFSYCEKKWFFYIQDRGWIIGTGSLSPGVTFHIFLFNILKAKCYSRVNSPSISRFLWQCSWNGFRGIYRDG